MGLIFNRSPDKKRGLFGISSTADLIPRRVGATSSAAPYVTPDMAMRNSIVWAALRLRADLESTMPFELYRKSGEYGRVDVNPYGFVRDTPEFMEFLYSSRIELDRSGNAVGIIHSKLADGYPREIELITSREVSARIVDGQIIQWKIRGKEYAPEWVWHEKQYTVAGLPFGLSPVSYAAWELGQYRSVQEFVTNWFSSGQTPRARLKNVNRTLNPKEAAIVKESWRASQQMGEPFVYGSDWEYNLIQAEAADADWLDAERIGDVQIARFFGVPANIVDAAVSGDSLTYANLTARELNFLVMHLQPALTRREKFITQYALPRPRRFRFSTDSLLRMDPKARAEWYRTQVEARLLAPSEARAMENRKPFTQDQIDEFEILGLNKTATGALAGASGLPVPSGTQEEPLNNDQVASDNQPPINPPDQGNGGTP